MNGLCYGLHSSGVVCSMQLYGTFILRLRRCVGAAAFAVYFMEYNYNHQCEDMS